MATYYKDLEDEQIFLDILESLDLTLSINIYEKIKNTSPDTTSVTASARNVPYSELTYRNLRYIILGCKNCNAEMRVKAMASFIVRANTDEPLNDLIDNEHLLKSLQLNLKHKLADIYKWSGIVKE